MTDSTQRLPLEYATLIDLLSQRAWHDPDKVIYTFLEDGSVETAHLTFGQLENRVRSVASALQGLRLRGRRAVLFYPPGVEFIVAFWGCLYAGVVAVPVYPPNPNRLNRALARPLSILRDSQPTVILTTQELRGVLESSFFAEDQVSAVTWVATDMTALGAAGDWRSPKVTGASLAMLQYTSGSTSTPNGVMLSHTNLLHNSACIQRLFEYSPDSCGVIWLPPYHDMGLIGGILQPVYGNFPVILMPPHAFLQDPATWLRAITRYRATISGGPNFAYDHCVRRITEEQAAGLDLSGWCVAFNGAEPVKQETLENFTVRFRPYGFREEAFYPCYGLAEATLIVSGGSKGAPPTYLAVNRGDLTRNRVMVSEASDAETQWLVSCGHSVNEQDIRIVDPKTRTSVSRDCIGEVWVSSPSVARGYWRRASSTRSTFRSYLRDTGEGPFLRTGDLGFIKSGELFITGRLKDLIIIRGSNYYPQDLELTVAKSHPLLRPDGAAFTFNEKGQEELVLVHEVSRLHGSHDPAEITAAIRMAVAEHYGLQAYAVVLVRRGGIPKTSSGKVQRGACRDLYLSGALDTVVIDTLRASGHRSDAEGNLDQPDRQAIMAADDGTRTKMLVTYLSCKCADLLGISPRNVDTSQPLVALGLDSLRTIGLKHKLELEFGVTLTIAELFGSPSLLSLATLTSSKLKGGANQKVVSSADSSLGVKQLSYGQQALWFVHQLAPLSPAYNNATAFRVLGRLDVSALNLSLRALVARHEALRSTFIIANGEPVLQIAVQPELDLKVVDASTWSELELSAHIAAEVATPFDLTNGPLLRTRLLYRARNEYILVVVAHHIVSDYWSMSVMLRDLFAFYLSAVGEGLARLPAAPPAYSDFAWWQRQMLARPEGRADWDYWSRQLAGARSTLELPTDHTRAAIQTDRGATFRFALSPETTRQLKALAKARHVTLYTLGLAAFQTLLHRFSGQDDIQVGSPMSGRVSGDWSNSVGYFVNPVVIRADFRTDPTFTDFLSQMQQTVLEALTHQSYPFPLLVERLQCERDTSRSPIFQAMFVWESAQLMQDQGLTGVVLGQSGTPLKMGEVELQVMPLDPPAVQFDLTLVMGDLGNNLTGMLQFNQDLFDPSTIARMVECFEVLLAGICQSPSLPVSTLPLLPDSELKAIDKWNRTLRCSSESPVACLHQLFEQQVERTPDVPAIVYMDQHLTFRELNERANQLGHYLQSLGVGPEVRVGLLLEPSLDMMIGLFGILKAGGAYVPLDPIYPSRRLTYMLKSAQAPILVTNEDLRPLIAGDDVELVLVDRHRKRISCESNANVKSRVTDENLAYVIYTSGSTGKPKGVMVKHASIVNLRTAIREAIYSEHNDRHLQSLLIAPLSFDGSVREYLLLLDGHSMHIASRSLRTNGEELLRYMRQKCIDEFYCTPSQLKLLLAAGLISQPAPSPWLALLGGEALDRKTWQVLASSPHITFFNIYGPTECTVDTTYCRVSSSSPRPSIGRPLANTRVHILDRQMQTVPIGVPGQMYIGGMGLARGYAGQPDLTSEKFIPDPFGAEQGSRVYKTGDLARYMPDGNIEFLGRVDDQLKIRGFTIEPGEVEAALVEHPSILQTTVVALAGSEGDCSLVAYLVCSQPPPNLSEIRSFLKERLPVYMLPASMVLVESFPLTANGKVDMSALPSPSHSRPDLSSPLVQPSSSAERMLVEVWSEVLGITQVSVTDNFFELGGTSLSLIRVNALIEKQTGTKLPVVKLFQYPTIRLLAEYLAGTERESLLHLERSRTIGVRRQERLEHLQRERNPRQDPSN